MAALVMLTAPLLIEAAAMLLIGSGRLGLATLMTASGTAIATGTAPEPPRALLPLLLGGKEPELEGNLAGPELNRLGAKLITRSSKKQAKRPISPGEIGPCLPRLENSEARLGGPGSPAQGQVQGERMGE